MSTLTSLLVRYIDEHPDTPLGDVADDLDVPRTKLANIASKLASRGFLIPKRLEFGDISYRRTAKPLREYRKTKGTVLPLKIGVLPKDSQYDAVKQHEIAPGHRRITFGIKHKPSHDCMKRKAISGGTSTLGNTYIC